MKRIDELTIKEKVAIIVNDGDGKYHKNKVESLVTLIQKEREEAIEEENMKMAKWCDEEGNDTVSYVEEFINAKSKKTKEEAVRRFAKEIWEMSKALYNSTVLDSDVNRDNYNALCRINKRCAEAIGDKEKYGEPTVESLAGVKK